MWIDIYVYMCGLNPVIPTVYDNYVLAEIVCPALKGIPNIALYQAGEMFQNKTISCKPNDTAVVGVA